MTDHSVGCALRISTMSHPCMHAAMTTHASFDCLHSCGFCICTTGTLHYSPECSTLHYTAVVGSMLCEGGVRVVI